jgi:hypothetical protein
MCDLHTGAHPFYTHTQVHTHTHRHTCAARTYVTHARVKYTCTCTHVHVHTYSYTHTHTVMFTSDAFASWAPHFSRILLRGMIYLTLGLYCVRSYLQKEFTPKTVQFDTPVSLEGVTVGLRIKAPGAKSEDCATDPKLWKASYRMNRNLTPIGLGDGLVILTSERRAGGPTPPRVQGRAGPIPPLSPRFGTP